MRRNLIDWGGGEGGKNSENEWTEVYVFSAGKSCVSFTFTTMHNIANIPELELIQIVICDGQKKQLRLTLPVILNTPPLIQG